MSRRAQLVCQHLENISRYISTAVQEAEIDLAAIHGELVKIENTIQEATIAHNRFLQELELPLLPLQRSQAE